MSSAFALLNHLKIIKFFFKLAEIHQTRTTKLFARCYFGKSYIPTIVLVNNGNLKLSFL